ncbi:MAG: ArgE/DapE family deacylase [Deltaproteobacteria bacterium]|nr:ArgE/DapE family deacylase [Deltaproteobacteria bacterium]
MIKDALYRFIDEHRDHIVGDLVTMISIPSVNNSENWEKDNEKAFQEWFAQRCKKIGLAVDMWAEDAKQLRPNVVAMRSGSGGGRSLMFNGHCDVVPVQDPGNWMYEPFSGKIVDGKIYGRGASDMKAGLAACIWTMEALNACGVKLKGDAFIASTAGEESGEGETIGAASVIRRGYRPDFGIIGEGTNLELRIASSSIFMFELTVRGKAVHGKCRNQVLYPQPNQLPSGPSVGVDALEKALPFIEMFRRMEFEWNHRWKHPVIGSGGHPVKDSQGVGAFCINPAIIKGGIYRASINPFIKINYMVWHPPEISRDSVVEEIKRKVDALAQTDDWLAENPPEIKVPYPRRPWEGFNTQEGCEGVTVMKKTFRELFGQDISVTGMRAVCDGTWFERAGVATVLLGPGSTLQGVHGDNEFVYIDNIIKCIKIYSSYAIDWCGLDA